MRFMLILLLALSFAPAVSAEESAREVVEKTVAEVLATLAGDGDVKARRSQIEQIVYARFDFQTMGKLVLARNWKKFKPAQRTEFVENFKAHLSRSYGQRIERYEQEKVEITGERDEQRGDKSVMTAIRGGQFDGAEVDYRLRNTEGAWRVIDVKIEGVSLVSNFRSQFKDIVAKKGPQGLIDQLKSKNAPEAPGVSAR